MRRVDELTPRLWKKHFADEAMPSLMEIVQAQRRDGGKA